MSHSRWESSSGDARLQTPLQPTLCSVLQEHHLRSQLWQKRMFHPAVSPSPFLTCVCLSPAASHVSSLPAAVNAQLLHFPRAARISNEHRTVLVPPSSSIHPPSKAASACSGPASSSLHSLQERSRRMCQCTTHTDYISNTSATFYSFSRAPF